MKKFLFCLVLVGAIVVAICSADTLPEADAVKLAGDRLRWTRLPAGLRADVRAALLVQLHEAGWREFAVTNSADDFAVPRLAWDFASDPVLLWWEESTTTNNPATQE